MTQAANNYGQVLYERKVPAQMVEDARKAFEEVPQLKQVLASPVIPKSKKHRVIDRIFPRELRSFFKVLVDHGDMDMVEAVFRAYHTYACEQEGILQAELSYVTDPTEEQLEKIRQTLCRKYGKKAVELSLKKDPALIGGFIIRVGGLETDWSMRGRLKQLEQILRRR